MTAPTTSSSGDAPPVSRRVHPLVVWGAIAAGVLVLQYLGTGRGLAGLRWTSQLLDGLSQFDGPEYLAISASGYEQRQLVWFPLYPTLIAGVHLVVRNALVSAVAITLASSAAATALYWRWLGGRIPRLDARLCALLALLVYPYAWFLYGVVYADALFLALCLASFVLFEADRRALSALAAALATATRPSGFALVLGLTALALERARVMEVRPGDGWVQRLGLPTRIVPTRVQARDLWPLAGLGGLLAYSAYQWVEWGSPLRFSTEQENYHEPGAASALKQQFFAAFDEGFDARHLATTSFQALLLALFLVAVPAVGRRFGWGYAVYVLGLALLPAISVSTFMGVGRYLLPAFPVFALTGEWLADRRRLRAPVLAISAGLLGLMAFGFSRGWYLS